MKKLLAVLLFVAGFLFSAAAEWNRIICFGSDVPLVSSTMDWDEPDMPNEHVTGKGFNLDAQFRLVHDNGFAFVWDYDIGWLSIEDFSGLDYSLIFGVGRNLSSSKTSRFILSGIVGFDILLLDDSVSTLDEEVTEFFFGANFFIGGDLYLNKKLSDTFAVYVQATLELGIGGVAIDTSPYIYSYGATEQICIFKPRFGICWDF